MFFKKNSIKEYNVTCLSHCIFIRKKIEDNTGAKNLFPEIELYVFFMFLGDTILSTKGRDNKALIKMFIDDLFSHKEWVSIQQDFDEYKETVTLRLKNYYRFFNKEPDTNKMLQKCIKYMSNCIAFSLEAGSMSKYSPTETNPRLMAPCSINSLLIFGIESIILESIDRAITAAVALGN